MRSVHCHKMRPDARGRGGGRRRRWFICLSSSPSVWWVCFWLMDSWALWKQMYVCVWWAHLSSSWQRRGHARLRAPWGAACWSGFIQVGCFRPREVKEPFGEDGFRALNSSFLFSKYHQSLWEALRAKRTNSQHYSDSLGIKCQNGKSCGRAVS